MQTERGLNEGGTIDIYRLVCCANILKYGFSAFFYRLRIMPVYKQLATPFCDVWMQLR